MKNTCMLCGREYDHPGLKLDRATQVFLQVALDAGETCDNCSRVLISGSPAEIDHLLGRVACPDCGRARHPYKKAATRADPGSSIQ